MSKVPSPRLPKKLRRTVVFCAALAAVFSLISAAIHSNSVLSQAQRAFPKLEEAAELYIQANKAPSAREKKMVFPQAKSPEKKG